MPLDRSLIDIWRLPSPTFSNIKPYDYIVYIDTNNSNKYTATQSITGSVITNSSFSALCSTLNTNLPNGGTIYFVKDTYTIDANITFTNNISLVGDGRGNTIFLANPNTAFITHNGSNITISRITFNGNFIFTGSNYPTAAQQVGVFGLLGNNVLVTDIEMKNFAYIGLAFTGNNVVVANSIVTGINYGTHLTNQLNTQNYGVWCAPNNTNFKVLSNCYITNCDWNAILMSGTVLIDNCYFTANAQNSGGQIGNSYPTDSIQIQNCYLGPGLGADDGIELDYGRWIIQNNIVDGVTVYGIILQSRSGVPIPPTVITGNIIHNPGFMGIGLYNEGSEVANVIVEGNIVYDDRVTPLMTYGIGIQDPGGSPTNVLIKDNVIYGATTSNMYYNALLAQITGKHVIFGDNIGSNLLTSNYGTFTTSGNGSTTTFNIPHGLVVTPNYVNVDAQSAGALGPFYSTVGSTNIVVTYGVAPSMGTNNVILWWEAKV